MTSNDRTIDRVQVSWIRVRMDPARAAGWSPSTPSISSRRNYASAWQTPVATGRWVRPWVGDKTFAHFWSTELGSGYLWKMGPSADTAWQHQTPFRWSPDPILRPLNDEVDFSALCYAYPSGSAVIVSADVRGPGRSPQQMLELLAHLATGQVLALDDGRPLTIAAMTGALLDAMDGAFDVQASGSFSENARTIATVTAASGWKPQIDELAHQTIDGLVRLNTFALEGGAPAPLSTLVLPGSSDYQYVETTRAALGKGHAVFAPTKAQDPDRAHQLGCYHHNLALSCARTAVLTRTVQWLSDFTVSQLSSGVVGCARETTALLARVYDPTVKVRDLGGPVWTTRFTQSQIKSAAVLDALQEVGTKLGMGTIVKPAADPAPSAP